MFVLLRMVIYNFIYFMEYIHILGLFDSDEQPQSRDETTGE